MAKRKIDVREYVNDIVKALPGGVLMTTKAGDIVNSMVIGWGTVGVNWAKPVFAAFVRESRYTKEILEQNPEFTINIPTGDYDKKIIGICGSKSGRDMDKIREAGLTPVEPETISVPGFKEFPLTLECRVIYAQKQDLSALGSDIVDALYPLLEEKTASGDDRDIHTTYFGEIVDAYIIE